MDDYLDFFDNLDEVIAAIHDVTPFLTFGCFDLAIFLSNNRIILKKTYHVKVCRQRLII